MKFNQIINFIKQLGPNKLVIGQNPLKPLITLEEKKVTIPGDLIINDNSLIDIIKDISIDDKELQEFHFDYVEAFETNSSGDLMPTESTFIDDSIWKLKNKQDLELKSNHFRFNTGSDSFSEDISF